MRSKGKLKLIQLSENEETLKLETDIYFDIVENDQLIFNFSFDLKESTSKEEVIIDGESESNGRMIIYGLEVIDLVESGFILKFMLHDSNDDSGLFVCAARFKDSLPQKGFINKLLYNFKF